MNCRIWASAVDLLIIEEIEQWLGAGGALVTAGSITALRVGLPDVVLKGADFTPESAASVIRGGEAVRSSGVVDGTEGRVDSLSMLGKGEERLIQLSADVKHPGLQERPEIDDLAVGECV